MKLNVTEKELERAMEQLKAEFVGDSNDQGDPLAPPKKKSAFSKKMATLGAAATLTLSMIGASMYSGMGFNNANAANASSQSASMDQAAIVAQSNVAQPKVSLSDSSGASSVNEVNSKEDILNSYYFSDEFVNYVMETSDLDEVQKASYFTVAYIMGDIEELAEQNNVDAAKAKSTVSPELLETWKEYAEGAVRGYLGYKMGEMPEEEAQKLLLGSMVSLTELSKLKEGDNIPSAWVERVINDKTSSNIETTEEGDISFYAQNTIGDELDSKFEELIKDYQNIVGELPHDYEIYMNAEEKLEKENRAEQEKSVNEQVNFLLNNF